MRKKVAYLDYSHIFAGAERVLYTIIANLDRTLYEPILVFPYPMEHHDRYRELDCKKFYLADGIKWWMGSDRWKHPVRGTDFIARTIYGMKLSSLLKREKADILHVNLLKPDSLMWILPAKKRGVQVVGHFRSQALSWIPPCSVQTNCDLILCVSDYSRSRLLSKGKHTETITLYDSIDIASLEISITQEEAKRRLGIPTDHLLISSVGQLSKHKGHDNAIHSFARIAPTHPEVLLFIAGGGRSEDLDELQAIVSQYPHIKDKVKFSGRQLSNIAEVYRASDITLSLTKVGEAFGLVPYESAWIDTPFIGPDKGAIKEFVQHKENGLLVDTEDLDDISANLEWALDNLQELNAMAAKLRISIKERLTPNIMARKIEEIYASLINNKGRI